jgi:HD-like signal output (HDOD) protein
MSNKIIDINQLIKKVDSLPTLPTVYYSLMEIMDNPRSTANDVAKIISSDQSSAAKVLKTANSPIYGYYGRIENITQAISYIGFDEVKNLVIALTILDFFNKNFDTFNISPVEIWKHSIAVGIMTRLIGKNIGAKDLENYFLAGILHDIGKILLINIIPDEYSKVIRYSLEHKITTRESELKILGISHGVAGEILAEKWNLPNSIKYSIRYHSIGLVDNKFRNIVAATHVANISVCMFGLGYSSEMVLQGPNKETWKILNLPDNFFSSVGKTLVSNYLQSANLLLR